MLTFNQEIPESKDLNIVKENKEMVLFEPFLMTNPHVCLPTEPPESDQLYYDSLKAHLVHLLYKFEKGWISSERQVIYSSYECISTIHFTFDDDKKVKSINVFQRSSNLLNIEDDIQFFSDFIFNNILYPVELNYFVSQPHILKGKVKKIED